MSRPHVGSQDFRLEAERNIVFRGTAIIRLEQLEFSGEVDQGNVDRLVKVLQSDCMRGALPNHIPALVDGQLLDSVIESCGTSRDALMKSPSESPSFRYPELYFQDGHKLHCLHGKHRAKAAKLALLFDDWWWTVDLYLSGTS